MCNGKQVAVFFLSFLVLLFLARWGGINLMELIPLAMTLSICFVLAAVFASCPSLTDDEHAKPMQGD